MLCDDQDSWHGGGEGGRHKKEGRYIYIYVYTRTRLQLVHIVVQEKLTQHCKAIISQLKNKTDLGMKSPVLSVSICERL